MKALATKLFCNRVHTDLKKLFQGNMDYFSGKFDIGVSLHACGVATDLVRVNMCRIFLLP
jgi:hypothetical protein